MSLPNSLIEALSSKNILPLVGAGVSMSITNKGGDPVFPSWGGLLQSAADKLKTENDDINSGLIELFLQSNNYHEAAKYAYQGLKKGLWHDFIAENFDPNLDDLDVTSSDLPKAIWGLSNEIITLNYDRILSWAYPKESAQVALIKNTDTANLANIINTNEKPLVWHLHGHIDDTANLVLTPDSYSNLYSISDKAKGDYQTAIKVLESISTSRSLLFIGCSLDDVELLAEIDKQNKLFSGNTKPHFALVKKSNETAIKEKLKDTCINIITFEDYGIPLVDKINEMALHVGVNNTETPQSIIEPATIIEIQTELKIAFLSANPFGQNVDYQPILKELKKLPYTINCLPLTENNLQNLANYDYVFIATKIIKDRLVIEDENACFDKIDIIDLQNNADLDNKKGVFLFTDSLLEQSKFEDIKLPILLIPLIENKALTKSLSSFSFQIFKKHNLKHYQNDALLLNINNFLFPLPPNNSLNKINKNETTLPKSIDKSVVKSFIGRNEDLVSLSREISKLEYDNGFITIKGSGGLGKTTIAKLLAIKLAERGKFKAGIEFVDCEHLLNIQQFKFNIAAVFNLEQAQNLEEHLEDNYDHKPRLIILDNFETLLHLEDKDKILTLLSFMSEYASIIVTSREYLKIEGEIPHTLRQMTLDEAYELFINNLGKRKISKQDKAIIRDEIIDRLLDKNPLAIKIITSNILPSKDIALLRDELQNDFFNISEEDLSLFDNATDIHIDRKKSLYGSILYSYDTLHDSEKKAFEKLSLFPDGIDIENFKKLSKNSKNKDSKKSLISDKIIIKLKNKSLIEESHGNIKLQSIIGRFAEKKLNETEKQIDFFDSVFDYNYFIIDLLTDLEVKSHEKQTLALNLFEKNQNNILKTISYIAEYSLENDDKIAFLEIASSLFQGISSLTNIIELIDKNINIFSDNHLTAAKTRLSTLQYFNGEFNNAYQELRSTVPFKDLNYFIQRGEIDSVDFKTARNALTLYGMEGNQASIYKMLNTEFYSETKANFGIDIGIFDIDIDTFQRYGFGYYEYQYLTNTLVIDDLTVYLTKLHKKSHLERIQVSYIAAKIIPYPKDYINQLVVVNPYSLGLKFLMLAFCEEDIEKAKDLYRKAIKNLKHIKYYYVEAIYFYAKFLKLVQLEDYNEIFTDGHSLAKKHCYRYLEYLFDELAIPTGLEYTTEKYPLPDFDSLEEII
ncbi:SIR2 family protein [Colwellia piezophila]|uniref:SIR2 family protein n=1 Tax=Colwellia piezophila TaxID=211668 RepID=UPI00037429C2|nr:SIR2 family protein [Colwellia piezophila]